MKRIIRSLTTVLTGAALFLSIEGATAQTVNSLYFLEKTPFHNKWNPAMTPNRTAIGLPGSSYGMTVLSDLSYSDLFYPREGKLLNVLHPQLPQADKDAFLSGLNGVSNFGMNMNMDFINLGIKLGKAYLTLGSSLSTDMGIGMPKDFFKLIMKGPGINGDLDLTDFNINSLSYMKAGAGLSIKFNDFISVGGTVNYLMGLSDIRLGFEKFNIKTNGTAWDVQTQGSLKFIAPEFLALQYDGEGVLDFNNMGNMVDQDYLKNFGSDIQNNLINSIAGSGLSFDLGVTLKPLKILTLSAAVIDFGSIKWNPENVNQAKSSGSFTFNGVGMGGDSQQDMSGQMGQLMNLKKDNNTEGYVSKLTTKVNIGAEIGLPNNKLSLGVLSQTGISEYGKYQDFMASLNLKPGNLLQTALTYSLLHGEMSSFGAAINMKLLFVDFFLAADYIPLKLSKQFVPINNSYFNLQTGINLMF